MRILLLSLLLTACTYPGVEPTPIGPPDLGEVTESHPCGLGFQAGNLDQTVAVFIQPTDFARAVEGGVAYEAELPGDDWSGTVAQGSNLFSNWCDDVMEQGEPVPYRAAEAEIISGHLSITPVDARPECGGGPVTAELSDLVVEWNGERLELGDLTIVNEGWGCFAG